ncbi:hypothetical protein E3C22_07930 [Jiella endophytica]|uniref:Uncharacterized protein n=1 Tax=Jiella endophytica TaxID=2558362 RepID=A0A4Y8RNY1_9HYPH|nr:hypothetical protein [Jiella endophytica]TFF25289.1 hypothetical protein E3C22_07930 [Jiella endophytica]
MEASDPSPVRLYYRRGALLGLPLALLCGTAVFTIAFATLVISTAPADGMALALGLSGLFVFLLAIVAALTLPLIGRFSGRRPAVAIGPDGIETYDMAEPLDWGAIERLTTPSIESSSGGYRTATLCLEIHPSVPVQKGCRWRWLIDGHANPLRVAIPALKEPDKLGEALTRFAPPILLQRSEIAVPGFSSKTCNR